jgi:hypothetical protein
MQADLQLCPPNPFRGLQPVLGWIALPIAWLLPFGVWKWGVALAIGGLLWSVDRLLRARPPLRLTVRATAEGVELVDVRNAVAESIRSADVAGVNVVLGSEGKGTHLRVERRRGDSLVFALARPDDAEATVGKLGLSFGVVGMRYQSPSLVFRYALLHMIFFLAGWAGAAWLAFGRPDATERSWLIGYCSLIWAPLGLATIVPTWIDLGRDRIAWRWGVLRRDVPVSDVVLVRSYPSEAPEARATRMRIVIRGGKAFSFSLVKSTPGLLAAVRRAVETAHEKAKMPGRPA